MNPILTMCVNQEDPISSVRCENRDGRWIVTIRLSGLARDSQCSGGGIKMTVWTARCDCAMLPIGTSSEVVETWMREVAEVGGARDYAVNRDGTDYLTFPARWGCDYRKATSERDRTGYLFGHTWPHRARLKSEGLRWAPKRKAWYGPLSLCRLLAEELDLTLYVKPPTLKLMGGVHVDP